MVKTSYIAHKLNQPLSTIQRRRRRLEDSSFLRRKYEIDVKQFGFRKADILISTLRGECLNVAKEIAVKHPSNNLEITQRVGDSKVNLVAQAIYKDTKVLYNILEDIKGMKHVEDVEWSEIISVVQKNESGVMLNLMRSRRQ